MSIDPWEKIKEIMNKHEYMGGVARSQSRVKESAEVFTPTELVIEILRYLNPEVYSPGKTVLDPACGDGQFLMGVKWAKVIIFGMEPKAALGEIYGVDIMRDNVDICKKRLGGGTIIMGDSLNPTKRLEQQTSEELRLMAELFCMNRAIASSKKSKKNNLDQPFLF